jgi:replication factor C subunit 3/5
MGNNDRLVIQDLLKEAAQTQQVDATAKHKFKVVVINEADSLTRDAQAALRRTMEKYSPNVRLILLANTTSNIIGPIKSRTMLIRIGAPSIDEIAAVLSGIANKEKDLNVKDDAVYSNVAEKSGRNLRKAILMFETMYAQHGTLSASTAVPDADWEIVIAKIADDTINKRNVPSLLQIRTTFYELISHCIPPPTILKTLAFNIVDKVGPNAAPKVVDLAAFYVCIPHPSITTHN